MKISDFLCEKCGNHLVRSSFSKYRFRYCPVCGGQGVVRELFENVSKETRRKVRFWVETSLAQNAAAEDLVAFRETLKTEEEKEYLDFTFNLMLEKRKEENV